MCDTSLSFRVQHRRFTDFVAPCTYGRIEQPLSSEILLRNFFLHTLVAQRVECCRREAGAIEAYQADGWRGASRDRVRPNAALDLATQQARARPW